MWYRDKTTALSLPGCALFLSDGVDLPDAGNDVLDRNTELPKLLSQLLVVPGRHAVLLGNLQEIGSSRRGCSRAKASPAAA